MAEFVERETVLEAFENADADVYEDWDGHVDWGFGWENIKSVINGIPSADVAPVVHSYWESYSCSQYMGADEYGEPKWRDGKFYVCHNRRCRRKTVVKSLYCPNCGAKMDGGDNDAAD